METIERGVRDGAGPSPARMVLRGAARRCGDPDAGLLPVFAGGVAGAVLAPPVFYPFSKTLRVAIELIMRPADVVEPADARP